MVKRITLTLPKKAESKTLLKAPPLKSLLPSTKKSFKKPNPSTLTLSALSVDKIPKSSTQS
jgi:hypothetical protein